MPRDVRTHTRRTATGKTTTVRHHTRTGSAGRDEKLKRKRGPNPGHARKLVRRSMRHAQRGWKTKAVMVGMLAVGEIAAWFTLSGTSMILALAAGLLAGISVVLVK